MRLNESLRCQLEDLLLEARQAKDPSTNGLLDRTDCLELISRLSAATQKLLNVTLEMQEERRDLGVWPTELARAARASDAESASPSPDFASLNGQFTFGA